MWLNKCAHAVDRGVGEFMRWMNIAGMVVLVAMMLLTVGDVFMRYVLNKPILGTTEITEFMMTGLCLGMAYCLISGRSIKMDMIVERFPPRAQAVIDSITYLIAFVVLVIVTRRGFLEALVIQKTGETSYILRIAVAPFWGVLYFAFLLFTIATLFLLVREIVKAVRK